VAGPGDTILFYAAIGTTSSGVVGWVIMAIAAFIGMQQSVLNRPLSHRINPCPRPRRATQRI